MSPRQRVGPLDAYTLDDNLYDTLKTQLLDSLDLVGRSIRDQYESELMLVLKLLLFKLTIWDNSTTYGGKLQNLKLVDSKTKLPISTLKKVSYGVAVVGGSYLWGKLNDKVARDAAESDMDSDELPRQRHILSTETAQKLLDRLTTVGASLGLLNFVVFLFNGRYLNTILRFLKVELAPQSRVLKREVNYEFQNRQLVWNALTEFLLFALPLINLAKLKNRVLHYINSGRPLSAGSDNTLAFLPERTCPICYENTAAVSSGTSTHTDVTNPYKGECGHIYCYVCIRTKLNEDEDGFSCLRCSFLIKTATMYRDVNPSLRSGGIKGSDSSSYVEVESADTVDGKSGQESTYQEDEQDSFHPDSDSDDDNSPEFIVENY